MSISDSYVVSSSCLSHQSVVIKDSYGIMQMFFFVHNFYYTYVNIIAEYILLTGIF